MGQSQYAELLKLFASPAVIVRDGIVIFANEFVKRKANESDSPLVIIPVSSSEIEIDGELYGSVAPLVDGAELYLSKDTIFMDRMRSFLTTANGPLREIVGTSLASLRLIEQKLADVEHDTKDEVSMFMNMLRKSQFRLVRAADNLAEAVEQDQEQESSNHIDFYAVDIRDLLVSLINFINTLFNKDELNLKYTDNLESDIIIAGNPVKLERMIINLLSNAILHSSPPGSPIEVILSKNGSMVEIDIINTGNISGDASSLLRLYEDKDTHGGIGIGLPAVLKIARLHGGNILISTGDDKFCTTVTLSIGDPDMTLHDVPLDYGDEAARRVIIGLSDVLHWEKFGSPFLDL